MRSYRAFIQLEGKFCAAVDIGGSQRSVLCGGDGAREGKPDADALFGSVASLIIALEEVREILRVDAAALVANTDTGGDRVFLGGHRDRPFAHVLGAVF